VIVNCGVPGFGYIDVTGTLCRLSCSLIRPAVVLARPQTAADVCICCGLIHPVQNTILSNSTPVQIVWSCVGPIMENVAGAEVWMYE
jgi:hypothetical protein